MQMNKDITDFSNFKTKAFSKYFYDFDWNIEELKENIDFAKKNNLKILPISGWTNMLFAFDMFDWFVIKFSNYDVKTNYDFKNYPWIRQNIINTKFSYENGILEISGFENISDVAEILYRENLNKKWMRFIWLPWEIAGAVVWNAGCFGLEIENTFLKAEVLNLDTLELEILDKEKMQYSYRNSIIKKTWNYILLKAWFDLNKNNEKYSYKGSLDNIIYFRTKKQPSWNTCWSFFKNPSKENPAWKLIEEVWLKWYKLWTAYFSSLHSNFLMSEDNGNYKDLLELIDLTKKKVKEKFNIELEEEVRIIKN